MDIPGMASSRDERWEWFIAQLGQRGSAHVVAPGVIEVTEVDEPSEVYWVHVDRDTVVRLGWATHDPFDDTVLGVTPLTDDPVRTGLDLLAFAIEETADSRAPYEDHIVYDGRR